LNKTIFQLNQTSLTSTQHEHLLNGYSTQKILSSFTRPQVVANLYEFLSSADHKRRYFEEWLEPKRYGKPLTSIVHVFFNYGSQCCPTTVWFQIVG